MSDAVKTAAERLKEIAEEAMEAESRARIDTDTILRILLEAERVVGAELTRLRLVKAKG